MKGDNEKPEHALSEGLPPPCEQNVWILTDNRMGNVSQALGVAEALGWPFKEKAIHYTRWACLPNAIRGAGLLGLSSESRSTLSAAPWPDLVIAAGRRTAPAARWIKRQNQKRTYLCQIMWPGSPGSRDFDLIVVPEHDRFHTSAATNIMRVTGAPHRITPTRLKAGEERWSACFAHFPRPLVALIVGGSTKDKSFTPAMARTLGQTVSTLMRPFKGSLVVTTSRRTGQAQTQALLASVPSPAHSFLWGDSRENPYFGYLALADIIIVTGDSVSMVSEACATCGPVFIYAPKDLVSDKHARLHQALYASGAAKPLGTEFLHWTHAPLNAANDIATFLRATLPLCTGR